MFLVPAPVRSSNWNSRFSAAQSSETSPLQYALRPACPAKSWADLCRAAVASLAKARRSDDGVCICVGVELVETRRLRSINGNIARNESSYMSAL